MVEIMLNFLSAKCGSFIKKYVIRNLFYTSKKFINTDNWDIDISVEKMLICMLFLVISTLGVFVLKRVTYLKICASLSIQNIFLKIGTFLFPQIFLLVDYAVFYKRRAETNGIVLSEQHSERREKRTEVESNV
ncbi:MAG: hypothetical protein U0K86_05555 [Agathobacter sp.]|nr:hypothetical protein [Agathobacter sp.]